MINIHQGFQPSIQSRQQQTEDITQFGDGMTSLFATDVVPHELWDSQTEGLTDGNIQITLTATASLLSKQNTEITASKVTSKNNNIIHYTHL